MAASRENVHFDLKSERFQAVMFSPFLVEKKNQKTGLSINFIITFGNQTGFPNYLVGIY